MLLAVALAPACARGDKEPYVEVSGNDAEMNAAIAKAQASFDEFLSVADKPPAGTSDFMVKVAITDANGTEHFWVSPFRRVGSGFSGVVTNDAEIVATVNNGDTVAFERKQVSDWLYRKDGRAVGGFTLCAMLKHMSAEEAAGLLAQEQLSCPG